MKRPEPNNEPWALTIGLLLLMLLANWLTDVLGDRPVPQVQGCTVNCVK